MRFGDEQLRRIRIPSGFLLGAVFLWLARPSMISLAAGSVIALLGLGMRVWAIGHLVKDRELATSGPYAFTRNPLYLGNFLIGVGLSIASGRWLLLILFLFYFIIIYPPTMRAEEGHLQRLFGNPFAVYRGAVPLFFPRITPYRETGESGFEWNRYWAHREYRAGVGFLVILLILTLFIGASAQEAPPAAVAPAAQPYPLTFAVGETLVYQARISKLIFSGNIGRLTFSINGSVEPPLLNHYMLRAEAVSDGVLPGLLGINVHDVIDSFVNPADFGAERTRKQLSEGSRRVFELTAFHRAERMSTFIKRDLANPDSPPQVVESAAPEWVQDILSSIYYLRAHAHAPGTSQTIPISDGARVCSVEVEFKQVEEIETAWGKVSALRVVPKIFGPGNLVEREGELMVWVSDEPRHLPLLARLSGSFGVVSLQLRDVRGAPVPAPTPAMPRKEAGGTSPRDQLSRATVRHGRHNRAAGRVQYGDPCL